jgi:hypothetical protein
MDVLMAIGAENVGDRLAEVRILVALEAAHRRMRPEQRKLRPAVVEFDIGFECLPI